MMTSYSQLKIIVQKKKQYILLQICIASSLCFLFFRSNLRHWLCQNFHKFFTCNCFIIVKIFCKLMQFSNIILENLISFCMLGFYQFHNFFINLSLSFK